MPLKALFSRCFGHTPVYKQASDELQKLLAALEMDVLGVEEWELERGRGMEDLLHVMVHHFLRLNQRERTLLHGAVLTAINRTIARLLFSVNQSGEKLEFALLCASSVLFANNDLQAAQLLLERFELLRSKGPGLPPIR